MIVDLKELHQFGVWEVGLLTSFKREVDQRGGILRLCRLNSYSSGYFHKDRFAGGTLSYIAESGSIGDYLDSLARLRCFCAQIFFQKGGEGNCDFPDV